MRLFLLLLLFTVAIAPCLAKEPGKMDMSLRFDPTGRPLITAYIEKVGNRPLAFRFDSAASHTVLYSAAAFLLGLETLPLESRRVYTATGWRSYPLFITGAIHMLGTSYPLGRTIALSDPEDGSALGLIGADVFQSRVLELDRDAGVARLHEDSSALMKSGYQLIKGRPVARGSLAIMISVGGVDIPAIVDTGATHTVINSPALRLMSRHLGDKLKRWDGPVRRLSAAGGSAQGETWQIADIRIGTDEMETMQVVLADLPIFTTLGARRAPAIILGMDYMGNRNIAFDFNGWALLLGPKSD